MINMGKTMLLARQCLYFGLFLNIPNVASQTTVNGYVNQKVKIPCGVGGSYTLPQWSKGLTPLTSQNVAGVNPAYPRLSYDTDLRTLVISSAQKEDSGTYECIHTGGTNSPQNSIVVITEQEGHCSTLIAVYIFYGLAVVILIVVIIICIFMLTMRPRKERIKVVVILIFAVVLLITVSAWFIAMQVTMDDCEKMTEEDHKIFIGLLVVEIFFFLVGVLDIILLRCCCDYPTEINPDPGKKRSVMKPKVKPQSGDLPPDERHGSDHSNVSRKDPIPPIHKNNSTTEFHMDNPGSERSAYRGLSTVSDQEYNKPRTNRLAPIDHKVDESIAGKKKKKTKMNTDVKLDNDNDKKKHIYY